MRKPVDRGSEEQAEALLSREFRDQAEGWANVCFSVGVGLLRGVGPPRDFCGICGAPTCAQLVDVIHLEGGQRGSGATASDADRKFLV